MKKFILVCLLATSATAFAQTPVKNGTIYKVHPYITAVNQSTALFVKGDTTGVAKFYADSVKFIDSPNPKSYNLTQAKKNWKFIFDNFEQIVIKPSGYPDGLEYTSDPFTVQSWWTLSCVNKKTKKAVKFEEVIFDMFNKDGKITMEISYYDTSAIEASMK